MEHSRHIRYGHRHLAYSYPVSWWQKVYSIIITPLVAVAVFFLLLKVFSIVPFGPFREVSLPVLGLALLETFLRLLVAYGLALLATIPLAVLVNHSPAAERIFLPFFDILESIPVLAFFPVVILFFLRVGFFDGAAVFVLFLAMLWNIVFSVVGGLKIIPQDIKAAAQVFGLKGFSFIRKVLLPAVMPNIITGSLLAWAQGWNIIIVAEVLHTYLPGATPSQDLFGIGSVLVHAAAGGENTIFIASVIILVAAIGLLNLVVWQRLLHYAERFKFE